MTNVPPKGEMVSNGARAKPVPHSLRSPVPSKKPTSLERLPDSGLPGEFVT
jgi:hypothetical protein